jgi:hypothetical protein
MSFTDKPVPTGGDNFVSWPVHDPENRENRLREDLTRRLTGVCGDLSSPDFEALVQRMTREQLRGERVMTRVFGHN